MASSNPALLDPNNDLGTLTDSIERLEQRIYARIVETEEQKCLIDSLVQMNDKINKITTMGSGGKSDRFYAVNKGLEDVQDLLSNLDTLDLKADVEASKELIMADEGKILRDSKLLEVIKQLDPVLDSKDLKDVDSLAPKLNSIRVKTLSQLEETKRINQETQKLIQAYREVMSLMKGRLASWDQRLKKMELEATSKKS